MALLTTVGRDTLHTCPLLSGPSATPAEYGGHAGGCEGAERPLKSPGEDPAQISGSQCLRRVTLTAETTVGEESPADPQGTGVGERGKGRAAWDEPQGRQ